jgi:hypothetical protein
MVNLRGTLCRTVLHHVAQSKKVYDFSYMTYIPFVPNKMQELISKERIYDFLLKNHGLYWFVTMVY